LALFARLLNDDVGITHYRLQFRTVGHVMNNNMEKMWGGKKTVVA